MEPGYYYRIENDFKKQSPEPTVVDVDTQGGRVSVHDVIAQLKSHENDIRMVLNVFDSSNTNSAAGRGRPLNIIEWAKDPLGSWGDAIVDKRGYIPVPGPKNPVGFFRKENILDTVYVCPEFLRREHGNRACFNKCT